MIDDRIAIVVYSQYASDQNINQADVQASESDCGKPVVVHVLLLILLMLLLLLTRC
jgi:hypothetical protein